MTAEAGERLGESGLLAAAAGGDERAFALLTEPHRRALHLHCYRMLGSVHDADDALQETLLRAWRGLAGYEPRSPLGAWLHRIATNVCLTALDRRRRRPEVSVEDGEAAWGELVHLQPYPDPLLDGVAQREAVELAFVTAVQLLPPKQRAVLLLRDVLGWSAREAAETLGDSVAAVNSALQRARAGLERARPVAARAHVSPGEPAERELLRRFMAAWDAADVDGIVRLLAGDAVLTMPPEPTWIAGPRAIGEFFADVPLEGRMEAIRLRPARANGQPALAVYVEGDDGVFREFGLMVLSLRDGAIAGIVGFAEPSAFDNLGLPRELAE